ncbi:rhamnogalacturonyl hydrolase YesR [Mucilaginibacter yixingensis]|uniref:Rhamnogalacturonyl hydrolase YesR n=1 Tax=Mucilaginibacter yixingensis TaxID=1295612 RepID=A0A2T5J609_9SPHI|nr:glycoside hydrolase family 88 protein [Mucilaginibacter yixingensis]PTQ93972.1 rhamnogalacturonyl hydrolase YesR [Mucilaginibacter yixingensis]
MMFIPKTRRLLFAAAALITLNKPAMAATPPDDNLKPAYIMEVMHRVADWQLNAWSTNGFNHPEVDWTNAACYTGIYALGNMPGNEKYLKPMVKIGEDLKWNTGKRRFMADDYCIGQLYAQLYMNYKDAKMIAAWKTQADSIIAKPHNESLEWKNGIANREWAWCDALFMGPTALAYLSKATGDTKYLDCATKLWWKTTDYLYNPAEQLYFRDQSFFGKKEQNGKPVFWSRGNGWVLAGLVRVMENMPANYPDRTRFEELYKNMAAKVASLQQPDGSWHASLLDPGSYDIKETSGTGFYCYALLWGMNHKLLDDKKYWPVVKKAWSALTSSVHADGMLGNVQPIGASPDKVTDGSTEVYGPGAFLLAGVQLHEYVTAHPQVYRTKHQK